MKLLALLFPTAAAVCPGLPHSVPVEDFAKVPELPVYDLALKALDLKEVVADLQELFTNSQAQLLKKTRHRNHSLESLS